MRPARTLAVLAVLALCFVCAAAKGQDGAACGATEMQARLAAIAAEVNGKVGVAAELLESGETVYVNGSEHFPMQSVYKLPIVMAALSQVDAGKLRLEQRVLVEKKFYSAGHSPIRDKYPEGGVKLTLEELMETAIVESDGAASDMVLNLVGAREATEYVRRLGVNEMKIVNSEKEIASGEMVQYRNWATPRGAVSLLKALEKGAGLTARSQELVMGWMKASKPGAARLKGLLPAGTVVVHKTGTSGTHNGMTRATNDIGIVTLPDGRHAAIAVFVADAKSEEAIREGVIAKSAKAIWDCWAK